MKFTMRWFGDSDTVRLDQIRQVPVVTGIVGLLEGVPVGDVWPLDALAALKAKIEAAGLALDVIESIPIPEAIKLGLPERDRLIENYCQSVRHLGALGVRVLCYNFMPVFDWMRTELAVRLADGTQVSGYDHAELLRYDLAQGMTARVAWAYSYTGEQLRAVLDQYAGIDDDALFENLAYFLRRVVPVAEEAGVLLALHPDDPPWSLFGLPRIVRDEPTIARILGAVDNPHNGLTFCTGSLGADPHNDLPRMIRRFAGRIHFMHMRNVKVTGDRTFHEVAHPTACGTVDMVGVMRTLVETGFAGPIRCDHGRMIWGETGRIGYGLYDRALGTMYLYGLFEATAADQADH